MPLTKLDTTAALVVIDLQKGIVGLPTVRSAGEIIGRAAQLARAFRQRGLPVVLVNVTGGAPGRTDAGSPKFSFPADWTELVPELEQHADDHIVSKQRIGRVQNVMLAGANVNCIEGRERNRLCR